MLLAFLQLLLEITCCVLRFKKLLTFAMALEKCWANLECRKPRSGKLKFVLPIYDVREQMVTNYLIIQIKHFTCCAKSLGFV